MSKTWLCFVLLSGWWSWTIQAQEINAYARLDTQQARIGEPIGYILEVDRDAGLTVNWPEWASKLGDLDIVEILPIDTISRGDQLLERQKLVLMAFDSGTYRIPPQEISYLTPGRGDVRRVTTGGFQVKVETIPIDAEAKFKDIKGVQEEPITLKEILIKAGLALGILGLLAGIIWVAYRLFKKKPVVPAARPKPPVPEDETAMRRLAQLESQKLWQGGQVKEYYVELTTILREYLEVRYKVPAMESVTFQILRDLQGKGVPDKQQKDLEQLLPMADLAKFAKSQPEAKENLHSMELAREFIKATRRVAETPTATNPIPEETEAISNS